MDDETNNASTEKIEPPELIEFFEAMGIEPDCPVCKKGRFVIQAEPNDGPVRFAIEEYVTHTPSGALKRLNNMAFPTIIMSCGTCGYVQNFSVHRINTWLNKQHPGRGEKK